MAYIVQLHNGIYSSSAVQYLQRITRGVIDRNKPVILVAHQFCGDAIVGFNETLRQLNVSSLLLAGAARILFFSRLAAALKYVRFAAYLMEFKLAVYKI